MNKLESHLFQQFLFLWLIFFQCPMAIWGVVCNNRTCSHVCPLVHPTKHYLSELTREMIFFLRRYRHHMGFKSLTLSECVFPSVCLRFDYQIATLFQLGPGWKACSCIETVNRYTLAREKRKIVSLRYFKMSKLDHWKMGLKDYSVDSNLLMEMLYRSSWDGKGFTPAFRVTCTAIIFRHAM